MVSFNDLVKVKINFSFDDPKLSIIYFSTKSKMLHLYFFKEFKILVTVVYIQNLASNILYMLTPI